MDPSTGTFISMDTYQGSIFNPVSLHKYLYANANPVMNSDPTGYFPLSDISLSATISNTIDTIQNDSFALAVWRSFKSGLVCAGVDVYRQLRTTGKINWGEVLETFLVSTSLGVVFGGSAILAASLKSAAIYAALGGSCLTFFVVNLAQAEADREAGDYDLVFLDLIFARMSLKGAKSNFDNAFETATAKNTAGTTTNPSPENTNTAKSNGKPNKVKGGIGRSNEYRDNWKHESLQTAIDKIAPGAQGQQSPNGQKIVFENSQTGKRVVYDIAGDYFRVLKIQAYQAKDFILISMAIQNRIILKQRMEPKED